MTLILIICFLCAAYCLWKLYRGICCWHQHRRMVALWSWLVAGVFLVLCVSIVWVWLSLHKLQWLQTVEPIAGVQVNKVHAEYVVAFTSQGSTTEHYTLKGGQLQVAAMVIIWHPWLNTLGVENKWHWSYLASLPVFHAGNHVSTMTSYSLFPSKIVWLKMPWLQKWLLQTRYVSAVNMPLIDGAQYQVAFNHRSLEVRPVNQVARRALGL